MRRLSRNFGVESGAMTDLKADIRRNMERESAASASARRPSVRSWRPCCRATRSWCPPCWWMRKPVACRPKQGGKWVSPNPAQLPALEAFRDAATRRVRLGLLVGAVINEFKNRGRSRAGQGQGRRNLRALRAARRDCENVFPESAPARRRWRTWCSKSRWWTSCSRRPK